MSIETIETDCGNTLSLEEWLKSEETGNLQRNLEERISKFLFNCPSNFDYQQMLQQLVSIGADTKNRLHFEREITELNNFPDWNILHYGTGKNTLETTCKVARFIVEHKTEIIIGERQFQNPAHTDIASSERGVTSRRFTIHGTKTNHAHIGWINGINNSLEDSKKSGIYLQNLAGGHAVSGVYNCSHGPVIDVLEAALLNHPGFSPNTAKLLRNEWQAFHEANADQPNARLLQVCHSQGAIDVRNALEGSPLEIRDRVIVVAIAPAAVVPKRLCFKSFNYASEKDFIYKLEPAPSLPIEATRIDGRISLIFGDLIDDRDELIILTPHPNAKGIDHEFQSLTYQPYLERVLANYKQHEGKYSPEEKGHVE